jgi:subtilase family serine protease
MIERAAPTESADFDVYLPLRDRAGLNALIEAQVTEGSPQYRKWLTPAQFQARFGPTPAAIEAAKQALEARGLSVTGQRGIQLHVSGTAAVVEKVLGVTLNHGEFSDGSHALVADRALTLPAETALQGALVPQFSTLAPMKRDLAVVKPDNFKSALGPYFTADLRQAYDFPSATAITGSGVTIGILMNGDYNASDIFTYFTDQDIPAALQPNLRSIPINGGAAFSTTNSTETHLDIEESSGMALGVDVELYNCSDLDNATLLFGLNTMVNDNTADVVNMSFGEPEVDLLPANNGGIDQRFNAELFDVLFAQGSSQGMTFVASSGDHGAVPFVGSKKVRTLSAQMPASDPYVTAVGGTNLVTSFVSGSTKSTYVSENASPDAETTGELWGSGGGISILWAKPSYQTLVTTPSTKFRTVPDLALHMGGCPGEAVHPCGANRSSDYIVIGGQLQGVIGTSASSPDIAGLFALKIVFENSRLGAENTDIYKRHKSQLAGVGKPFPHTTIAGNNGKYTVKAPYDLVLGNGTVDARQLLGAGSLPAAGNPDTASNP